MQSVTRVSALLPPSSPRYSAPDFAARIGGLGAGKSRAMSKVLVIFALILAVFLPQSAVAQRAGEGAADIFTVSQVSVEAEAASAEEARLIAQDRGRARALQVLLQRLTPRSDWPYLPRPRLNDLLDMQVGFEVANERFSTLAGQQNSYLADITYSFRRDRVRSLLRSEGISFSESQAAHALVLPVFEHEGQTAAGDPLFWEEENQWAVAWYETDFSHELLPFVLPLADLADLTVVNVDDVMQGNWDALQFLANRYGVTSIYVAHAIMVDGAQGDATLYVRMTELREAGVGQVTDTRVAGLIDPNAEEPLSGLAGRAISLLSGELQERWKSQTLVSYDTLHRIDATALYSSLGEWETIRGALENSATVDHFETHALSARGAELSITFAGSAQQLSITLGQRDVLLSGSRGYWDIRVRGAAVRELLGPNAQFGATPNASGFGNSGSARQPIVETVTVQPRRQENAPVLTEDDLEGIFGEELTPEQIEERRARGLGDEPGSMQPVGN